MCAARLFLAISMICMRPAVAMPTGEARKTFSAKFKLAVETTNTTRYTGNIRNARPVIYRPYDSKPRSSSEKITNPLRIIKT
jgi:hypothetical protein